MPKPRFSFQKHIEVGAKLAAMRDDLMTLCCEISSSYPHTNKCGALAEDAMKKIDSLRCKLDSQMFQDCPSETAGDDWKNVYYGTAGRNS